jgi:hypothetical protein
MLQVDMGEVLVTFTCDGVLLCCTFAGHRNVVAGDVLGQLHSLCLELLHNTH